MERLLDKLLIANAVEFSAPGSNIEVALTQRGPRIQLTVSNSGPTRSEDELENGAASG